MKFILNKDILTIEDREKPNSGSVNYYEIPVEYDESWDNLTITAVLVEKDAETGKSISVINNKVYIDNQLDGKYEIGFVGYTIENEEKTYQISTNLKPVIFNRGAGQITTQEQTLPTPTEWEIYIAQIQEMLEGITMIPSGGTIGQALVKKSNTDYDYEWKTVQGGGSGGTTNHAELDNLDYEHSGHTGFQPAGNYVEDNNYVHTDNNFTDTYKSNVEANTTARHTHSNKSVLDDISSTDITNWNNKSNFSGSYEDLSNKPTIPSEVTEATVSGWGFTKNTGTYSKPSGGIPKSDLTSTVQESLNKADSALQEHQSLSNYYTKSEVDSKVSSVYKYKGTVATYSALPSTGLTIGDVYNVESDGSNYAWTGTVWDKLGGDIDLSNYQTKISSSNKLSSDLVDDTGKTNKFVTASEKTTWNSKYEKPSGGISKSDLDSSVQTSLSKADTALQTEQYTGTYSKPSGGIPNSDLASAVQTSLGNADKSYSLLHDTIDLSDADRSFTGYIYNGAFSGSQEWISYEFKAENIDKILSVSAFTTSSAYKNINFYSEYVVNASQLSSYFISTVPLSDGANKVNNYSNIDVPDNCKAIVISHKVQEEMATPTLTLQIKKYDKEISEIKSDISEISNSSKNVKAIYKDIWNANDFIFIGDELWLTKPSSEYTGYDQEIRRFKLIDGEWVRQSKLYTDFGHWNTVDYCPENDCLIFGNGANSESSTGNYFTVVKNPLALSGSVLIQDVGIKYNVDIGFKVQAVWGNDNMGEHNIVYLTSNYTRRVLKVLLTKDTNGNFDGNFITLNDTSLPTIIGTGGGDFWGDCIYIGDGTEYAIWKLSVSDYTVQKIDRTAYLSDGTVINGSVQGVYVDKDYIWVFYNIGGSSSNYLVQYYKGGLTNKSIVTDDHINSLIDTKLGVIENGSY